MAGSTACLLCGRTFAPYGGTYHSYCRRCTAKTDREAARKPRLECGECGKAFPSRTRSARYCSKACRAEAKRRLNLEHQRKYLADPVRHAMSLARSRAAAIRARKGGGRPPPPPPRGTKKAAPSTCRLCGRTFAPTGHVRHTAHCKRCAAKIDREIRRKMTVDCKECGKAFATANRAARYCSKECSAEGRRRSDREYMRRRKADPERRAARAAYQRARYASRRAGEAAMRRPDAR